MSTVSKLRKSTLFLIFFLLLLAGISAFFAIPKIKKVNFIRFLQKIHSQEEFQKATLVVSAKYEGDDRNFVDYRSHAKIHPGSNYKLFTAAASLANLKQDFMFQTKLFLKNENSQNHLVVVGSGDPSFSKKNLVGFIEAARKIGKISGDLYYDDRIFQGERFGPGWRKEWQDEYFAVPITGLQLDDNLLQIIGRTDEKTKKFAIITSPLENYPLVDRMTYRENPNDLQKPVTAKMDAEGRVILEGDTMKELPFRTSATIHDPSFFTASVLKQELVKENLMSKNTKVLSYDGSSDETLIFVHESPALKDIVFQMLKFSKNNYGETFVRTLGKEVKGEGSQEKGVLVLKEFFQEIGIPEQEIVAFDGSGLAPDTRVSAFAILTLFDYVNEQSWKDLFWNALPESQVDGTLKFRFENAGLKHTVIAKTGTHEFASSLSGKIVRAPKKKNILFSVHFFEHPFSTEESVQYIIPVIDRIVSLIDKQF